MNAVFLGPQRNVLHSCDARVPCPPHVRATPGVHFHLDGTDRLGADGSGHQGSQGAHMVGTHAPARSRLRRRAGASAYSGSGH